MTALLNIRVALIVAALLLAAFGIHNAFVAVFSKGAYEIIYRYDETVRACMERYCVYGAELSIANTGDRDQELVVVEIAGVPGGLRGSHRILNLSAAEPRSGDPEISWRQENGVSRLEIGKFAPGTLVLAKFSGVYPAEQQTAEQPTVEVKVKGRVIEGDPRAITLGRYVTG
ncbi:MAG: hypothetical protein PVJ33_15930 [Lysobacterales bacterium]